MDGLLRGGANGIRVVLAAGQTGEILRGDSADAGAYEGGGSRQDRQTGRGEAGSLL